MLTKRFKYAVDHRATPRAARRLGGAACVAGFPGEAKRALGDTGCIAVRRRRDQSNSLTRYCPSDTSRPEGGAIPFEHFVMLSIEFVILGVPSVVLSWLLQAVFVVACTRWKTRGPGERELE